MEWVKVNNLVLTNTWQLLDPSVVAGNLFRITQSWDIYPQGFKALIVQSLTANTPFQFFGTRSFYPSSDLKIINLPIPNDFLSSGITNRYLLMKLHTTRQFTVEWNITVENFIATS